MSGCCTAEILLCLTSMNGSLQIKTAAHSPHSNEYTYKSDDDDQQPQYANFESDENDWNELPLPWRNHVITVPHCSRLRRSLQNEIVQKSCTNYVPAVRASIISSNLTSYKVLYYKLLLPITHTAYVFVIYYVTALLYSILYYINYVLYSWILQCLDPKFLKA
jgi:hypothetical protein